MRMSWYSSEVPCSMSCLQAILLLMCSPERSCKMHALLYPCTCHNEVKWQLGFPAEVSRGETDAEMVETASWPTSAALASKWRVGSSQMQKVLALLVPWRIPSSSAPELELERRRAHFHGPLLVGEAFGGLRFT